MARRLSAYSILFLLSVASPVLAAPGDLDPSFGTGGARARSDRIPVLRRGATAGRQAGGRRLPHPDAETPSWSRASRPTGRSMLPSAPEGMVETAAGTGQIAVADEVVLQPDGKIVVAGYALQAVTSSSFWHATRPTAASMRRFGSGGIVTLAGPGRSNMLYALVLQSDGKLVAAGAGFEPSDRRLAVRARPLRHRWNASMRRSAPAAWSYGPAPRSTRSCSNRTASLVAAGYYQPGVAFFPHFAVFRYEADGSPDPSFGTGGMVSTSISVQRDHASAIVRQADGGFVVGGWRWDDSTNSDLSLVLVRYDAAGVLDATFGTDGIAQVPDARYDTQVGLAEQPNGKLVMAAHLVVDDLTKIAVIRWQPDGTLDLTFGDGGVQTTRVSSPPAPPISPGAYCSSRTAASSRSAPRRRACCRRRLRERLLLHRRAVRRMRRLRNLRPCRLRSRAGR